MEKTQDRPLTDGGHAAGYGRLRLTALAAWIFVLLFSLCLYDALLYTSLKKEVWSSAQSSAQLVARHVCQDIESGMRFGKKLSKFSGLDKLLRHVGTSSGLPVALVDPLGREIGAHGAFPADALNAGFVMTEDIDLLVRGDAGGRTVFVPINSIEGSTHGYAAARVDSAPLNAALWGLFREQLVVQAAGAALGLVVLFLLFRVWGRGRDAHDAPCFTRKGHALAITVFVLVLTASGLFAMQRSGAYYTANLERDLDRTGLLLTDELNRLLLVGVSLDRMDNVGSYLSEIAAMHGNAVMLEIRDSRKGCLATTSTGGEELLTGERTYALLQKGGAHALQGGASCTLHIGFLRGPWLSRLWAMGLDMLTMVAIAVIFMLEILYCLTRGMDLLQLLAERRARVRAASAGVPEPGSVPDSREAFARSSLLRPLSFFMMFAIDMSVSFIPLRMAELLPAGAPSRDMLLGLPISAGMAMTGLAAMVCGTWVKRQGPRPPLMIGFVMVSLGCLGSMLAAEPWHFVLARGLAGAGYGFILVTSQACTVREGLLGDMFAGVYAGSLCGSAMGAMLA
ncbi:MAG: hypothetical protein Q4F72_07565, partial [Desulfovibrionaceae bacterium]|nr:hypothetical protein [Desulfovibrionaceae bacterium]